MKKRYKGLLFLAGAIAVPTAINHLIFKTAAKPQRTKIKEDFYHWRYGDIRYIVIGEGEPLVLIHGICAGGSLREWDESIIYLSKHYKVYALDLLGFGNSQKPAMSYSAYLYISLINDFITDVIGKPVYAAASSDAAAYTVMASSFKEENFKKLLLISPTGIGDISNKPYPTSFGAGSIRNIIESPLVGTSIYNMITSKMSCQWFLQEYCYYNENMASPAKAAKYHYYAHVGGIGAKYPIAAFIAGDLSVQIEPQLKKLKIPTHVLWGEDNQLTPVSNIEAIKKANPNINVTVLDETRLLPHSEKPKTFYKLCRTFFDQAL